MRFFIPICVTAALLIGAKQANAAIIGVGGGTGDPASTLGPYTMTPFALDNSPGGTIINSLASPLGGSLTFSYSLSGESAPSTSQWGNSYTANVYLPATNSGMNPDLTLTLPSGTAAFYLFAEPNGFSRPESITVTAQDGTFVTQVVTSTSSSGAQYFGFYATGSDEITSLTVSDPTSNNSFIVGEFGIAAVPLSSTPTPEPSSLVLSCIFFATFGMAWSYKHLKKSSLAA
jgi:hypothetical protein